MPYLSISFLSPHRQQSVHLPIIWYVHKYPVPYPDHGKRWFLDDQIHLRYESDFLSYQTGENTDYTALMGEPVILREKGSGSKKSADYFIESLGLSENDLNIIARINDPESIKNLVAGGLGISVISEKAAQNLQHEKSILVFPLPENTARRQLYIVFHKDYIYSDYIKAFIKYVKYFYQS